MAGLALSCGISPTAPSKTSKVPARLEIQGPRAVAPGETVQFTATLHFSDRSTQDVTGVAVWRTQQAQVLTVSSTGAVTGHARGETRISASHGLSATRDVMVLPAGTFRLMGAVFETGSVPIAVSGATITVTNSPAAGLSATTDGSGRYQLYGVSGDIELAIRREGYASTVERVVVTDHHVRNFELGLLRPREDYSGTYTMTVFVDGTTCDGPLPDGAGVRKYTADVSQFGPELVVRLSGATFVSGGGDAGSRFRGRVDPNQVVLTLRPFDPYYYYYFPDVVEQLTDSWQLVVSGTATLTGAPAGLSGILDGAIFLIEGDIRRRPVPKDTCRSANHRITLSR